MIAVDPRRRLEFLQFQSCQFALPVDFPTHHYGTFSLHPHPRRFKMVFHSSKFKAALAAFIAIVLTVGLHTAFAQDVVHGISGIVKSVDKGTKTFVVKSADGTEHTFKWTDKTVVKGTKDTGKGIAKGSEDTGKAVAKGTDDTGKDIAKGSEDAGEDIGKGSVDTYMGAKEGTKVTVKYTEKGGDKTAVGVKDAGKATGKALSQ
jgi:hypothetical protein